jgi:hypothetical protein
MDDHDDEPGVARSTGPPSATWPLSDREGAGQVAGIDSRIAIFSIRALGYDPGSADPKPRDLLDWVHNRQKAERRWRQVFGAAITAFATAVLGGVSWPLIQHLFRVFGP